MKPDWFQLAEEDGYPDRNIRGYLKRKGGGFLRPLFIFLGAVGALLSVLFITPPELGNQSDVIGNDLTEVPPNAVESSTNAKEVGSDGAAVSSESAKPVDSIPSSLPSAGSSGSNATTGKFLSKDGEFTGSSVSMQYGTVQVRVSVKDGKITDVVALKAPTGGNLRYTNMAVPILIERVIKSQSANIQGVSGASYTSESFKKSLQYAISLSRTTAGTEGTVSAAPPTVSLGGITSGNKSEGFEDEERDEERDDDEEEED